LIKDYYWHYIAYDDLKEALKTEYETDPTAENPNPKRREWKDEDEQRFIVLLEGELDKVFSFQKLKSEEIVRRIRSSEKEVKEVTDRLDHNGESVDDNDEPTEDDFLLLEADLSDIIADVHDLAKFTQLNYTGFQKILKKHDVCQPSQQVSCRLTHHAETNQLQSKAFIRKSVEGQAFLQGQL